MYFRYGNEKNSKKLPVKGKNIYVRIRVQQQGIIFFPLEFFIYFIVIFSFSLPFSLRVHLTVFYDLWPENEISLLQNRL